MDAKAAVLEDALGMLASRSVANDNHCDLMDSRLRGGHVRPHTINKHHPRFACLCVCALMCVQMHTDVLRSVCLLYVCVWLRGGLCMIDSGVIYYSAVTGI